ncbi:NifB/NifX family molybdenum-iron cluster-binding protein [Mobilitalea sibirica]|uniref:NifB/NifX family molybdenum-iron cluster-binding protein n=1 Tax=Mobilitalea sibirica TaxID=1462919 RepID=A0A8J7L1X0_9FIRM|nr:NifB/NifX family molybdenum-iron cluster-binding protein [Mobilitalea sibirica]MBH1939428.1 NifB/NifX family molybdenum-iron cluster-binding protein [Mobilitalea sibirica]
MKIAIASDGVMVSGHFGHCEGFTVYEVVKDKITDKVFAKNPGHRPGFLPVFLHELGVKVIIAGGMGETAQQLFYENGIEVYTGARGNCDAVANHFITGQLKSTGSVCREHAHEGNCG